MHATIHSHRPTGTRGFTLVELLVVIAIVTTITSLVLVGFRNFGNKITLQNVTYRIALALREAQLYGVAGKYQDRSVFQSVPVGVFLDTVDVPNDSAARYVLFSDINPQNRRFDPQASAPAELIEENKIVGGYDIEEISARRAGESVFQNLSSLVVLFQRPEPDAHMFDADGNRYDLARIVVRSPQDDRLQIVVNASGQISIQRVISQP